jgi:hypothetical protein
MTQSSVGDNRESRNWIDIGGCGLVGHKGEVGRRRGDGLVCRLSVEGSRSVLDTWSKHKKRQSKGAIKIERGVAIKVKIRMLLSLSRNGAAPPR